ncbi:type IV pilus secretin PilQ [Phocoenobacter skyensis]|uniref:Protein transport protein HofQ n=1 Tax=Phocoenobacter skyensis TaxID=97481 RepID=A0A1H7UWI6_9PAST|nr:type IV pilus secretin PilQ [Pasteurella skyensis]MDP8162034.1 type IV pilus secretin PilQ [Pasteurella skyensis]MDP8172190.1 type IV pilus secretin PilQ [Pasteurella skyensis]MDP8176462.1 type IV pilus secretin PilQ [Pasteurella skyensis]MDP8178350.1 type IV pilus secretin PilQ [Pasteurella skyensis]MDP8182894.1 type IV pilus secretin PilQ [Pasteurella skyensis]
MKKIVLLLFGFYSTCLVADPFYKDVTSNETVRIDEENDQHIIPINEDLPIKNIHLNYARAVDIVETLTKGHGSLLDGGYIHFDKQTNTLILKGDKSLLAKLTTLIHQLDKPIKQVAIEARIVTISSENLQELGVRWGMFSPTESASKFAGRLEGNGFSTNNLNVNFPVLGNAASAVVQIASFSNRLLDLELTALEQENSIEIIASPSLITTNEHKASIKQGTEIAYPQHNEKGDITDVEFRDAVLGLEVIPHFSKNNQILLDLLVTQNSPNTTGASSQQWVTIDKQEIKTQVLARHGETIVLGGIFQNSISKEKEGVPILGSLPFLKYLFSHTKDKVVKRELVIFVTPHIINPQ